MIRNKGCPGQPECTGSTSPLSGQASLSDRAIFSKGEDFLIQKALPVLLPQALSYVNFTLIGHATARLFIDGAQIGHQQPGCVPTE